MDGHHGRRLGPVKGSDALLKGSVRRPTRIVVSACQGASRRTRGAKEGARVFVVESIVSNS